MSAVNPLRSLKLLFSVGSELASLAELATCLAGNLGRKTAATDSVGNECQLLEYSSQYGSSPRQKFRPGLGRELINGGQVRSSLGSGQVRQAGAMSGMGHKRTEAQLA